MVKVVAEGAEAVVYETSLNGITALLKRRMKKEYRISEMDTKIRSGRSKKEAKIMAILSKTGIKSPKLVLYDGYDIYMSPVEGKKLSDIINLGKVGVKVFAEIGIMLGKMHDSDIAHGDYTPANIIIGSKGPYVIDFGLSELTSSVEEKALDVLLMKRSVAESSYEAFLGGYKTSTKEAGEVLKRLSIIERRGRYQTRTLA